MEEKILRIKADSLEKAREKISNQTPDGLSVLDENVISDGKPRTQREIAETIEGAFDRATQKVPADATILEKRVLKNPHETVQLFKQLTKDMARAKAEKEISSSQSVVNVSLKTKGRKGFLGIGRQPDVFEVCVWQNAVVEIEYVQKAEVHVRIGIKPYQFRNPGFYSGRQLSDLLGVILLAPEGEAESIASSQVFVGTVEDTIGAYFRNIAEHPLIAIGHPKTRSLYNMAVSGMSNAQDNILGTGIESSLENTQGVFPPEPVGKHYYHIQVIPSNEKTGSPFLLLAAYK